MCASVNILMQNAMLPAAPWKFTKKVNFPPFFIKKSRVLTLIYDQRTKSIAELQTRARPVQNFQDKRW